MKQKQPPCTMAGFGIFCLKFQQKDPLTYQIMTIGIFFEGKSRYVSIPKYRTCANKGRGHYSKIMF